MCLAVVCVEAGFSQIWSHILLNAQITISYIYIQGKPEHGFHFIVNYCNIFVQESNRTLFLGQSVIPHVEPTVKFVGSFQEVKSENLYYWICENLYHLHTRDIK